MIAIPDARCPRSAPLPRRGLLSAVDDVPLDSAHDIVPSLLTTHLIVSRCSELRALLDLYGAALRRCVTFDRDDEQPSAGHSEP